MAIGLSMVANDIYCKFLKNNEVVLIVIRES